MKKRVLVVGGYGILGAQVSRALAQDPEIDVVVAGRRPKLGVPFAQSIGASFLPLDVHDTASLKAALPGTFALVHAAGPFTEGPYDVARACIEAGAHYVDLAEARGFVSGITNLDEAARRNAVAVVSGAGTLPAVSSALVELLSDDFGSIDEIHIALTHGNRNRVGLATLHTLLAQPGRPFRVFERGRWQAQEGWRRRERVRFAAPVGRRSVYRCDAPDLALFPEHYGARSVTFHEGLQLAAFNRGLRWLGRLRRWGLLKQPPRFARPLLGASRAFARLGDASGALRVLVRGRKGRQELERYADLMARDASGPLIACAPAIALVRRWVHAPRVPAGASPCVGLVSLQEITAELRAGDIVLVRG